MADVNFVKYIADFDNVFATGEDITEFWDLNAGMIGTLLVFVFIGFIIFFICLILLKALHYLIPKLS